MSRKSKTADLSEMLVDKGTATPATPPDIATTKDGTPDGRSLRRTGREQWNVKVTPEAKAIAFHHAKAEGCTMGEILERALTLYDQQNR